MHSGFAGWHRRYLNMAMAVVLMMAVAGCSGSRNYRSDSDTPTDTAGTHGQAAPSYYDFGDVLIPKELKVLKNASFVYTTGGISAGVLSLKGYVDAHSLITFFESNMAKDNWKVVGAFKSPRTVLLFGKESRWCVINITEQMTTTAVEIWVAPSTGQAEVGLIKD